MQKIPAQYKVLYSREDIAKANLRMGAEITRWAKEVWENSHTDILVIPILRGGIFLVTDLVREVDYSVEIAPARTWAYEVGVNLAQRTEVSVNLEKVPAKGRHVLLVDDICDSGRTIKALTASLKEMGALEVRSAVLIHRNVAEKIVTPEYIGFTYDGPEWFVGYGMEDTERWRNLDCVAIIQQQK